MMMNFVTKLTNPTYTVIGVVDFVPCRSAPAVR